MSLYDGCHNCNHYLTGDDDCDLDKHPQMCFIKKNNELATLCAQLSEKEKYIAAMDANFERIRAAGEAAAAQLAEKERELEEAKAEIKSLRRTKAVRDEDLDDMVMGT